VSKLCMESFMGESAKGTFILSNIGDFVGCGFPYWVDFGAKYIKLGKIS
jgi:hypothetical protein